MNELDRVAVLVIQVPVGADTPYAIDESKIYVREEGETNLAVRDEIVELVKRNLAAHPAKKVTVQATDTMTVQPPRTGVEVTGVHMAEKFGSPEAIWELRVERFPAVVTMDSHGRSLHKDVLAASQEALDRLV